ncbi:MAG: hypothetical protein DRO88_02335 [Promethearchaeia archaeon]|nr:MAG: hypothetical protein DRO88_02335 [Candidatus Lokiarchaeia archaeon]
MVTLEIKMNDNHAMHEFEQILRSVFHLTKKDVECFMKLRKFGSDGTCVQNLTNQTNTDRSVEQKKLNKLRELGLVTRVQLTLSQFQDRCSQNQREELAPSTKKGYLYVYRTIPDSELYEKIQNTTTDWLKILRDIFLLSVQE